MTGRYIAAVILALGIGVGVCPGAFAANSKALLAAKAVRAFVCATYAAQAEMSAEEQRLVSVGFQAGKAFLEAVDSGEVTDEEFRSAVPAEFSQSMMGPAHDFILGRIYESAREDTVVRLMFEDENGKSFYFGDSNAVEVRANKQYRSSFCDLIK